jgi:pantoate--beta-alanine ligase
MRTIRTVAELRAYVVNARAQDRTIGLVPTMGAFHDGHLALMRAARDACDEVVVSLFVNPSQFNDADDLSAYPRDERGDAAAAADAGVDILFAPAVQEVYPDGFSTTVTVDALGDTLEGEHRPGHFTGVATVVTKLLNMVTPDVAYFGQKDAQQAALIRKLVRDLDIPARIEILPTVREPDGLAMSSRNRRLSPAERERALALHRALQAAAAQRDPEAMRAAALAELERDSGIDVEYVAVVDPETFLPFNGHQGPALIALAARVGDVRLIDNTVVHP